MKGGITVVALVGGISLLALLCVVILSTRAIDNPSDSGGNYTPSLSIAALYYSKATYCEPNDIHFWNCTACRSNFQLLDVHENASTGSLGYIGIENDERLIVAFRGSSNDANWWNNIRVGFSEYNEEGCEGCKVHTGFLNTYNSLHDWMETTMYRIVREHSSMPVHVTGHSLGGALAVLASLDIRRNKMNATEPPSNVTLYTFGEPRVGNKAFVSWAYNVLDKEGQLRVTHLRDPVPHMPPMLFKYLHLPHEIYFDNDGNSSYTLCGDSVGVEDKYCSNYVYPITVSDHLLYLGTCTSCDCSPSEMKRIKSLKLSQSAYNMAMLDARYAHQQREREEKLAKN